MDLISVIVPIYKVEQYLNKCIESIVNQSYRNLEIILVDDGSPDLCPEICDDWASKDNRIKVVHKNNGGLSDARNAGLDIAGGEYIGYVDSDDWINSEMYEKLMMAIRRDNSDIAVCSVEMDFEDGSSRMFTKSINCVLNRYEAQEALIRESKLKHPVWYKLYKRQVISDIEFEKGKYHEDVFWSYRVIGNANLVSVIDYVGYHYCQHCGSIMGENYSLKRLDAVEAKAIRQVYLEEKFPKLASVGRVDLQYTCMYNGQLSMKHLSNEEKRFAIDYLKKVSDNYCVTVKQCLNVSFKSLLWMLIEKYCFVGACWIRNFLRIGV